MMGVTFDTNVLLSAILWDDSVAQKLLFILIRQKITIYSTKTILTEYQKVLKRDFDFSQHEIAEALEKVLKFVTLVEPKVVCDIVKEDPDDNKIIECALESKSNCLITYDRHLLKIKEHKGIGIIKPEEAMAIF